MLGTSERANLTEAFTAARRADWNKARFSAEKSGNAVAKTIIEWRYLLDENAGDGSSVYRIIGISDYTPVVLLDANLGCKIAEVCKFIKTNRFERLQLCTFLRICRTMQE